VLRVLAAVFALIAIVLLSVAMIGMVKQQFSERTGWFLRAAALGCFALTVILNTVGH
jgi:hypothetical protein